MESAVMAGARATDGQVPVTALGQFLAQATQPGKPVKSSSFRT